MTREPSQDTRVELKYVLDESLVQPIKLWARQRLGVDPHCSPELLDSYDVHTLYLDSQGLDLYYRSGTVGSTKHRIRRYGQDSTLWLECKRKKENLVRKNRMAVPEHDVWRQIVSSSTSDAQPWCGDWFLQRIQHKQLCPAVDVHYRRFARMACIEGDNVRLTIDSQLQANRVDNWQQSSILNRSQDTVRQDFSPVNILELKFNHSIPHVFKELLTDFALAIGSFSKFRTAVALCRLPDETSQSPDKTSQLQSDGSACHATSTADRRETKIGAATNA